MKCCDSEKKCPLTKFFDKDNCLFGKFCNKSDKPDEAEIAPDDKSGIITLCALVGAAVMLGAAAFFVFRTVLKLVKDKEN